MSNSRHRINGEGYAYENPRRAVIFKGAGMWWIFEGFRELGRFPTHAEAIAEVDRLAHPIPPNLSAHGAQIVDDAAQAFREGR